MINWKRRLAVAGGVGCLVWTCARTVRSTVTPEAAEEAMLSRRVEGQRQLLASSADGSFVDFDQILVVVHQRLVQELLGAAVPFEQVIEDRYRIRIESATTEFAAGLALVRLEGTAELIGQPVSAQVAVLGGLEVQGLDPESGLLQCHVQVFAVEAVKANVAGVDESARDLVEALGRSQLSAWQPLLDVPVRVDQKIQIPALDNPRLQIPAADFPFGAKVTEVKVFNERLWIGIAADVTAAPGEPPS